MKKMRMAKMVVSRDISFMYLASFKANCCHFFSHLFIDTLYLKEEDDEEGEGDEEGESMDELSH